MGQTGSVWVFFVRGQACGARPRSQVPDTRSGGVWYVAFVGEAAMAVGAHACRCRPTISPNSANVLFVIRVYNKKYFKDVSHEYVCLACLAVVGYSYVFAFL